MFAHTKMKTDDGFETVLVAMWIDNDNAFLKRVFILRNHCLFAQERDDVHSCTYRDERTLAHIEEEIFLQIDLKK